jgi:Na+/proline symporter
MLFLVAFLSVFVNLAGGLAAVIYTDTLQSFILIIGALIVAVIGEFELGN